MIEVLEKGRLKYRYLRSKKFKYDLLRIQTFFIEIWMKIKNVRNTTSHSIPFILFKNNDIILKFEENQKSVKKNKTDSNERNQYEMILNDI